MWACQRWDSPSTGSATGTELAGVDVVIRVRRKAWKCHPGALLHGEPFIRIRALTPG